MARHLAAGPRLHRVRYSGSLGTGSTHHWSVGRRLWRGRACSADIRAVRGVPPALSETVSERFGLSLSRSSCLNYLHRLGFAFKRPKKRLLKADEAKRESFVAEYGALWVEAERTGGKIFFADEAHFRADAELRGKWVMKGTPALVDSTSPRYGEKASYYSAVCLETGEVEWMELEGNINSGISAAFLNQLRQRRSGQLNVIWDNAPAHRGAAVQQRVGSFLAGLASCSNSS